MVNTASTVGWFDLASKHDLLELEGRIDGRLAKLETAMMKTFVTWMLASQAATLSIVVAALVVFR
jgi:hypothetical protein